MTAPQTAHRTAEWWETPAGVRVPAVTADGMREVDRLAIEETGPNLFQMMENAGRSLALEAIDLLGDNWRSARIVVLAGNGGNGGGGICAARHLANRGARVVLALTAPDRITKVSLAQLRIYRAAVGHIAAPDDIELSGADLLVDAAIGYGLAGAPREPLAGVLARVNEAGRPVLALDVPSGLDATAGTAPGTVVRATRTLALALPKAGLAAEAAGAVRLADLGIPPAIYARLGLPYRDPFGADWRVDVKPAAA